jgi:plasmid maintenance system antidote protein VapI
VAEIEMRKIAPSPGNIALWLNHALAEAGLNQAELARQLTRRLNYKIDRSTVSKMMHNQRKVSADEMIACLAILGSKFPPPWDDEAPLSEASSTGKHPLENAAVNPTPHSLYDQTNTQPLALKEDSCDTWVFSPGEESKSGSLYAVDVSSADMAPRYRPGERVWVDPSKPVQPGDDVFVERIDARTKRLAGGIIRQFVGWEKDELALALCTPGSEERFQRQSIIFMHPILFCARGYQTSSIG